MAKHKEYYKKEVGGFPQVWAVMSLGEFVLLVIRPCTKNAQIMH